MDVYYNKEDLPEVKRRGRLAYVVDGDLNFEGFRIIAPKKHKRKDPLKEAMGTPIFDGQEPVSAITIRPKIQRLGINLVGTFQAPFEDIQELSLLVFCVACEFENPRKTYKYFRKFIEDRLYDDNNNNELKETAQDLLHFLTMGAPNYLGGNLMDDINTDYHLQQRDYDSILKSNIFRRTLGVIKQSKGEPLFRSNNVTPKRKERISIIPVTRTDYGFKIMRAYATPFDIQNSLRDWCNELGWCRQSWTLKCDKRLKVRIDGVLLDEIISCYIPKTWCRGRVAPLVARGMFSSKEKVRKISFENMMLWSRRRSPVFRDPKIISHFLALFQNEKDIWKALVDPKKILEEAMCAITSGQLNLTVDGLYDLGKFIRENEPVKFKHKFLSGKWLPHLFQEYSKDKPVPDNCEEELIDFCLDYTLVPQERALNTFLSFEAINSTEMLPKTFKKLDLERVKKTNNRIPNKKCKFVYTTAVYMEELAQFSQGREEATPPDFIIDADSLLASDRLPELTLNNKEKMTTWNCLPIRRSLRAGKKDMPLLIDCHPDLWECVLLNPIEYIEAPRRGLENELNNAERNPPIGVAEIDLRYFDGPVELKERLEKEDRSSPVLFRTISREIFGNCK